MPLFMLFGRIIKYTAPLAVIYKITEAQRRAAPAHETHE